MFWTIEVEECLKLCAAKQQLANQYVVAKPSNYQQHLFQAHINTQV